MTSTQAQKTVQSTLDACTSDPKTGIPGLVFCAVDKSGEYLVQAQSGNRSLTKGNDPMTQDTVFWIASCTKFITAIACMQLVEQGKIGLDDSAGLYKFVPELKDKQVFDFEKNEMRPRQGEITLRMLLAHTAGFGYEFFDPRVKMYEGKIGRKLEAWTGRREDIMSFPLLQDPGQMWEYGVNMDWAGILVEAISGMTLDEYFKKNILGPVGVEDISFFPTDHMRKNLTTVLQRDPQGQTSERKHLYQSALDAKTPEQQAKFFCSGGAGCFAKPKNYVQILATVLNDGVSPKSGNRILKKETIDAMWENQIPKQPDFARNGPEPADLTLANPTPDMYPQKGNPPQGWGISFFLTIEEGDMTGRGPNTAWWAGICNQYWWIDRKKGVAGMMCGQVLPFGDLQVVGNWIACEKAVYDALGK